MMQVFIRIVVIICILPHYKEKKKQITTNILSAQI